MNERLRKLAEAGQSVWIDSLSRDDIENGNLERMIEEGVVDVTSNPTIFQKGISHSTLYDEQLQELSRREDDPKEIFLGLAKKDIQDACDLLMPVFERTNHLDGYVSLEVSPDPAYDTPATVEEATHLHELVDRLNLMVKIPATLPGLVAIEDMIATGNSINITLIFSLQRYKAVTSAYIRGLQRLVAAGGDPSRVASVASFFVSRVDTETDRRLDRSAATTTSRAVSPWTTPSSPMRPSRRSSPERTGSSSSPRARPSSVRYGPRPRRRTRKIGT